MDIGLVCWFSLSAVSPAHTHQASWPRSSVLLFPSPHRMLEFHTFTTVSNFFVGSEDSNSDPHVCTANAFCLLRHLSNPCPHSSSWEWPHPSTRPATVLMAVGRDRVVGTHPGVLRGSEVTAACVFGRGQSLSCLVSRCAWL